MKKLLLFSLMAMFVLTGCGKFSDGSSVWQAGLWIIPLLTCLGSIFFLIVAYKKSKSGSEQQLPGGGYVQSNENVPIYKIGQFYFFVALLIATVAIIIMVNSDK